MSAWKWVIGWWFLILAYPVYGTNRYYNSYVSYGSGDTIIQNFHLHQGSILPNRKWNLECLDGEAMVGLSDWADDFARLQQTWCKFSFPNKPPSSGLYPYYGGCHVSNPSKQYFCFEPENATLTINTFITAMWSNNWFWFVHTPVTHEQLYKCCNPPEGYYIDYVSCYYVTTHDSYMEYYDTNSHFLVYCGTGYVMTGVSKKINPTDKEYHIDWIQCCRLGFGPHSARPPPVTYAPSGSASYYSGRSEIPAVDIPKSYQPQYRSIQPEGDNQKDINSFSNTTGDFINPALRHYDDLLRFGRPSIAQSDSNHYDSLRVKMHSKY